MVKPVPGPDRLEKGLRLGCGGLLGLPLGALIALRVVRLVGQRTLDDFPGPVGWAVIGLTVVACALLALRLGDGFWDGRGGRF